MQIINKFFTIFFIVLLLITGQDSFAQTDNIPVVAANQSIIVDRVDIEHLISVIEDPQTRQKLIADLKTLIIAEKALKDVSEPGLSSLFLEKIKNFNASIQSIMPTFSDIEHMINLVSMQISDTKLRAIWLGGLCKFTIILGGGLLVEFIVKTLLLRPRRFLENKSITNRLSLVPLIFYLIILELLQIMGFVIATYWLQSLNMLMQVGEVKQATYIVITSYMLIKFLLVLEKAMLMPKSINLRFVPLSDKTAKYMFIWVRRLIVIMIGGYFLIQAMTLLGISKGSYNFFIKMLGLLVTTLLIILVLQNRQVISDWIRCRGKRAEVVSKKIQILYDRLADIWHILASIYITTSFVIWALQIQDGFEFIVKSSTLSIIILIIANLLIDFFKQLFKRSFTFSDDLRSKFPKLENKANRYIVVIHNVVLVTTIAIFTLMLVHVWGGNVLMLLTSDLGKHVISSAFSITFVLIGTGILWEIIDALSERYLTQIDVDGQMVERSARIRTLLPLFRNVIMVTLIVMVILIVLSEIGINTAPLLAGAGVVGVAIGFGSQKLVQDVITGAFILFENTIAVGDLVQIGEHKGNVESMTIRTLRLRDIDGQVHTLPFSNVASVINLSRDFSYHVFQIGVSYCEDIDFVISSIEKLGKEMYEDSKIGAYLLDDSIEVFGIDKFADSSIIIGGRLKTLPGKQIIIGREFNIRIKKCFDELLISLPYPARTLYFEENCNKKIHKVMRKIDATS
ncbi:MAG: mechanosensitive ion channel [Rhodospirillaceae bacterium]|jgi:small conductance mechanosensitive channel|nr:mechanosensitive ion channel [Rhodospirillaceae bacterium]